MKVRVDGYAWVRKADLTPVQLMNLRRVLTVQPRATSTFSEGPPKPILLFEETDDLIGLPRGFYLSHASREADLDLQVSDGAAMSSACLSEGFTGFTSGTPRYDEQTQVMDKFVEHFKSKPFAGGILQAGCSFGKALAHGEPVITPSGEVPIEAIRVGDLVAGTDGSFYPVEGVYPQGVRDLYRVTFTDGTHVDCDGDHVWTFVKRRSRHKRVDITTSQLASSGLRGKAGRVFWLPEVAPVCFGSGVETFDIEPYTLGALLGDGHLSGKSVCFTTQDEGVLRRLVLPPLHRAIPLSQQNAGKATTYRISKAPKDASRGVTIWGLLGDLGLHVRSHGKFVPTAYKLASAAVRLSVLQGLLDTDGSSIRSGLVEYSTVSSALAEDVKWLVSSLGGKCVVAERETFYTKNGEKVGPFASLRCTIKMPKGMEPFRLERKRDHHHRGRRKTVVGRAVEKVEQIGRGEATCISVASPDRLFLTRGFVPTHNTSSALRIALGVGLRTIILVNKEFLLDQWVDRVRDFFPGAKVGVIRQSRCEVDGKDYVVAMMQSLAARDYPEEIYSSFGMVVTDECHRAAAPTWSSIVPRFSARYRLGLTATPRRKDGAERVFFEHIGPILHEATSTGLDVRISKMEVPLTLLPISRGSYYVPAGELNKAQIENQVAEHQGTIHAMVPSITKAVGLGRKVFIVSSRLEQLWRIQKALKARYAGKKEPTYGWVTGSVYVLDDKGERVKVYPKKGKPKWKTRSTKRADVDEAGNAQVIFATYQMVEEAYDNQAIDAMFLAMPISDVEQAVGRSRRPCEPSPSKCMTLCPWRAGVCKGKPEPIVKDIVHVGEARLENKWKRRRRFYQEEGLKIHE